MPAVEWEDRQQIENAEIDTEKRQEIDQVIETPPRHVTGHLGDQDRPAQGIDPRFAGKSKYSLGRLVGLALDGLISFSYLPLRLATMLGFGVSTLSLTAAVYYLVKKLTVGVRPPGFATQVVLALFLGGVQLITIGVGGEYIGHVLDEVKHRPAYVVREVMERKSIKAGGDGRGLRFSQGVLEN